MRHPHPSRHTPQLLLAFPLPPPAYGAPPKTPLSSPACVTHTDPGALFTLFAAPQEALPKAPVSALACACRTYFGTCHAL
eukprot:6472472-Pyramimonas_sp.AAC.1